MPILKQRSHNNRISSFFASAVGQSDNSSQNAGENGGTKRDRSPFSNKLYKNAFAKSAEKLSSFHSSAPPVEYPQPPHPPHPPHPQPNPPQQTVLRKPAATQIKTDLGPSYVTPADGTHQNTSPPGSHQGSGTVTPVLTTPVSEVPPGIQSQDSRKSRRRSWFINAKEEKRQSSSIPGNQLAWIVTNEGTLPYNISRLLEAEQVPELWDETGDTFVYLFPRTSNKGPSFRIDSSVFSASPLLTRLAYGRVYSGQAQPSEEAIIPRKPLVSSLRKISLDESRIPPMADRPLSMSSESQHIDSESSTSSKGSRALSETMDAPPSEIHMYLPLALSTDNAIQSPGMPEPKLNTEDIETLVAVRNFFAFLIGSSLVGTERKPSIFPVFLQIAGLLEQYEFSNFDGSTYGEVAATSFEKYVEELNLADVRASQEKAIEGIVLGERMRCWGLYNESFVHSVGKYQEITELKSPVFNLISPVTRNRMERASMDLYLRQKNINTRLEGFEFAAIFAGVMNSKTADESKQVRFDAWKSNFMTVRKHILAYYKHRYGSWPPKASSKKNNLETSGLNRLVLKDLYYDFSCVYDLLVDRASLTTRCADGTVPEDLVEDTVSRALRRVMSEYDRSSPPVQPAVPFDVPLLPTLAATRKGFGTGDEKKDAKARSKKLKNDEIHSLLGAARNKDSDVPTPFLDTFRDMERRAAHGKTIEEICDFRCGAWIFIYAVLQSLPMLVVDAPGVKFTQNVEYFLCEVPRSAVPWARDPEVTQQRNWYGVAGGAGVVSLPADVVEHGVEGIYRRSHCWEMAEKWTANASGMLAAAVQETLAGPPGLGGLAPPGSAGATLRPSTAGSSGSARHRESVMMLGLEALPLPAGVSPAGAPSSSRPASSRGTGTPPANIDPTKTFDSILQGFENDKRKKR